MKKGAMTHTQLFVLSIVSAIRAVRVTRARTVADAHSPNFSLNFVLIQSDLTPKLLVVETF